jgi:hypothetical protein
LRLRRAQLNEPSTEELELHVILPPNFADAAQKGKVMLVFEAQRAPGVSPGRVPLNTLRRDQPFKLSEADERLLTAIEELAGEPAGMLVITTREFAELLPRLVEHPRVTLGKSTPFRVIAQPWIPSLRATLESNGEIEIALSESGSRPLLIEASWIFANQSLQPLGLSRALLPVLQGRLRLKRSEVPAFLNNEWPKLTLVAPVAPGPELPRSARQPTSIQSNFSIRATSVQVSGPCAHARRHQQRRITLDA